MENEEKKNSKGKEKTVKFSGHYKIHYSENEVDLSLDLENAVEDRFFAYSLTLMDLFHTVEDISRFAPPELTEDFMTAIRIIKSMAEAVKMKIEIQSGLTTEEEVFTKKLKDEKLSPEGQAKLKELLKKLKTRKVEGSNFDDSTSENPINMESIKIDTTGMSEEEIEEAIREKMQSVLKKIAKEIKSEKTDSNETEPDKPEFIKNNTTRPSALDLEM